MTKGKFSYNKGGINSLLHLFCTQLRFQQIYLQSYYVFGINILMNIYVHTSKIRMRKKGKKRCHFQKIYLQSQSQY